MGQTGRDRDRRRGSSPHRRRQARPTVGQPGAAARPASSRGARPHLRGRSQGRAAGCRATCACSTRSSARRCGVAGSSFAGAATTGPGPLRTPLLDALLSPIVLAAAELLTSPQRLKIRACAAEDCGWLFLDTSRSGRRRWCTMQSCGNRAKARRFHARAAASPQA